ncbi:hypothetical protein EJ07DRAFT_183101 [Lizonia empirigonia]|nr:hypothetical protein EJ07DRAFT_183101 [Lizonia empirigonia]
MESIISKVHVELVNLAATYADAGCENVTLSLVSDFQRTLFTILDERIRINDLEQSEGLKDEMEELFEDEYPTKPAWPYLNQLDKQDRCFAKLGCRFKHGAALYKSPLCKEHFVCKNHQSSPCLAKHEHVPSQEHRAEDDTKEAPANQSPDTGKAETFLLVEQAKESQQGVNKYEEMTIASDTVKVQNQKSGDRNAEKEKSAKFNVQDVQYPWEDDLSHGDSSSSDESEWDDNA